jgi:hypothetical protein
LSRCVHAALTRFGYWSGAGTAASVILTADSDARITIRESAASLGTLRPPRSASYSYSKDELGQEALGLS